MIKASKQGKKLLRISKNEGGKKKMIIAKDENDIKADDNAREEFYKIEAKFEPSEAEQKKELEKHLKRISAESQKLDF